MRVTVIGIYPPTDRQYAAGMAAIAPITPEPRRFSSRPPRQLWIGVAMVVVVTVLVVVTVGLQIGIPIYQQQEAIRSIGQLGESLMICNDPAPEWLEDLIGWEWTSLLREPIDIKLTGPQVTDETLKLLVRLAKLETVTLTDTMVTD